MVVYTETAILFFGQVSQLAAAGIVNGYPDGTFKGQNDITRYEMAQMVAKAMANQDRANAEQKAIINRLVDEFSNELNNLGVRVAKLEDRVGNDKLQLQAAYGYMVAGSEDENQKANHTLTYVGVKGDLNKHVNLCSFYTRSNDKGND